WECFFFFFFFQAEDGIRDLIVTGVQTCALPISFSDSAGGGGGMLPIRAPSAFRRANTSPAAPSFALSSAVNRSICSSISRSTDRSEERRVGKECRSRWST